MNTSPMDKIISNSCPSHVIEEGGENNIGQTGEYYLETHCVAWTITARLVECAEIRKDEWFYKYEILTMVAEDC